MNDFYEQKANKYKYKYLELKKRIEYNDIDGAGCFSGFCRSNKKPETQPTQAKIKEKITNSYDKLSIEDKATFKSINDAIAHHNNIQKGKHIELQDKKEFYNYEQFFKDYCTQKKDHGDYIEYNCLTIEQIEQQKQDIENKRREKSLADKKRYHEIYLENLKKENDEKIQKEAARRAGEPIISGALYK